jgi:hydroxymethylbilane synthase
MRRLVIGSRGSQLALWQSNHIQSELQRLNPLLSIEIVVIKTTGDKISEGALGGFSGASKGIFVKEIEAALLNHEVDLAVHSLKDVPTDLTADFTIAAIPSRADARDALVADPHVHNWTELPPKAKLGTSSLRRTVQLKALRKDFQIITLRGNVDTRLRKRREHELDAVVLAAAGLKRLGFENQISCLFPPDILVPAVGQGALAIEARAGDDVILRILSRLDDILTRACVEAERVFLKRMGGGCQVPMGAHATIDGDRARFSALVASPVRDEILRSVRQGEAAQIQRLAHEAADDLLSRGAERILQEVER